MTITTLPTAHSRFAPRAEVSTFPCDFCGNPVSFHRIEIGGGPAWGLEPNVPGSGSDNVAIWCASCGRVHKRRAA